MAGRKSNYPNAKLRKDLSNKIAGIRQTRLSQEIRNPRPASKGIRTIILEIYHDKGILEAYKALEEYNKKFNEPIYTREIFEKWIKEDNQCNNVQEEENEHDR